MSGELIVVASGSGQTRSFAAIVAQGRAAGARVALFTAREPISRIIHADVSIVVPARPATSHVS